MEDHFPKRSTAERPRMAMLAYIKIAKFDISKITERKSISIALSSVPKVPSLKLHVLSTHIIIWTKTKFYLTIQ